MPFPASTFFTGALSLASPLGPSAPDPTALTSLDLESFMSTDNALRAFAELQQAIARIEADQRHLARDVERALEQLDVVRERSHAQSKRLAQVASDSQVADLSSSPEVRRHRSDRRIVVVSALTGTGGTALGLLAERIFSLLF